MLKKIVRDILIIAGIGVLAMSTSHKFMSWVSELRNENEAWWGVHKNVEGDLVGMSYLHRIEKFCTPRDYQFTKPAYPLHHVDLYAWGDSYIWKIPDTAYAGISNYKFGWRYRDEMRYNLDSAQTNILLIEITERYMRSYFDNTDIFNHVKKEDNVVMLNCAPAYALKSMAAFEQFDIEKLFNPYINQNLEYNLFNYNFINPVRQVKASMNYNLFNRASGDVVIANNGTQLFLKETVATNRIESSYYPVQPNELNHMVSIINEIYDHYKADGFDEVYISFIPNPASIMQAKDYNQLIPLLESHSELRAPVISIYSIFKNADKRIYRPGDTHWNNEGLQLWLAEVNKMLIGHNKAY